MKRAILCFCILGLIVGGCEKKSNTDLTKASAGNQNLAIDQTSALKQNKQGLLLVVIVGNGCGKKAEAAKQVRVFEIKDQKIRSLVSSSTPTDTVDEMDTVDEDLPPEASASLVADDVDMAAQARELAVSLSDALAQEQTTAGKIQLINKISGVHDPSVVDALLMAMEPSEAIEVQGAATNALLTLLQPEVWYGNTDGLDYFVYALDPDLPVEVRASAVQVLEYTNDSRVESILQDLRNDSNPEIRAIATEALDRINKRN